MNWTRGLIRIWLLGSIAWTYLVAMDEGEKARWLCHQLIAIDGGDQCSSLYSGAALSTAVFSGGASLASFVIGAALVWALRGFRQGEPQA